MNDRCGLITGTREELARLGRCTAVEVSTAIDELNSTETATKTERNGIVTLVSRRMKREFDARKHGAERARNYRVTHKVTPEKRDRNGDILYSTFYNPDTKEREGSARADEPVIPTVDEIANHFSVGSGIPEDFCRHFHAKITETNGWIKNNAVIQWRLMVPRWWSSDRSAWGQKKGTEGHKTPSLPDMTGRGNRK